MTFLIATLPILLTIATGALLVATGLVPKEHWEGINRLNFRLLIPVVLIEAIGRADLGALGAGRFLVAVLGTLTLAALAVLALRRLIPVERLPDPGFTTLFQSTTRWNAFIALAAAHQIAGPKGLALLALAMAVLIPVINLANILVLIGHGPGQAGWRRIAGTLARNPLIQGCAVGLALNAAQIPLSGPIAEWLDLIGRAALGMGLLAVGAGISLRRLFTISGRLGLGLALRPGLVIALFLPLAWLAGLGPDEALIGAMVFAVPAAANGYVVARQMGGDADLYADVMTWQTILSLALLPALAALVTALF